MADLSLDKAMLQDAPFGASGQASKFRRITAVFIPASCSFRMQLTSGCLSARRIK